MKHLLFATALLLSACGGGSEGDTTVTVEQEPNVYPEPTLKLKLDHEMKHHDNGKGHKHGN